MDEVKSAAQAIKIAKEVIGDAGYAKVKITNAEYDEDEEVWMVGAETDDGTTIEITIDSATGEVTEFLTS